MKLSDIKGDRVLDVIAELVVPIANIAMDENAARLFKRETLPEGKTAKAFVIERFKAGIPPLIKEHKSDLVCILATLEGVTAEEYLDNMTLVKLTKDFMDLITDDAVLDLFI